MGSLQKRNTEKERSEVSEYTFKDFVSVNDPGTVKEYNFADLSTARREIGSEDIKRIRIEKNTARSTGFAISPLVKEYRGHNKVDLIEKEQKIQEEVERRLLFLKDKAIQEAKLQGIEEGRKEVFSSLLNSADEKLQRVTEMVETVLSSQNAILENQKDEVYRLIKNLTKWITLKEISADKDYTKNLLEKLFQEINSKNNMLIQVNATDFENMPEILNFIQEKFGKLNNMRVEIDPDITSHGLILETENGILNATIQEQFKCLDKLFETVLDHE